MYENFAYSMVTMRCFMGKPVFRVSNTNRAVQPQKMARVLKFQNFVADGLYYLLSENKGADKLRVTAQLICIFVFT